MAMVIPARGDGMVGTYGPSSSSIASAVSAQTEDLLVEYGGWALATKTVAFTGAAGLGAQGTVSIFTVTGDVEWQPYPVKCTESLVGAATMDYGITGTATDLVSGIIWGTFGDATTFDTGEWWGGISDTDSLAGGEQAVSGSGFPLYVISNSVILTVGAADITDGTLVFYCRWRPLSAGATVAAA